MKMQTIKKIVVFIIMLTCFLSNSKSQIVYTDVNPDSVINGSYNLDLNNDGVADFILTDTTWLVTQGRCGTATDYIFKITPLHNDAVLSDTIYYPYALQANDSIAADLSSWLIAANQALAQLQWQCDRCGGAEDGHYCFRSFGTGHWVNLSGDRYIGLQLIKGSNTYYGWVRLSKSPFSVKDYAYNSIPGQPILAGEGGNGGPLPLTFINFDGVLKNNEAELTWATANEINNQGFDVERSRDGKNFIAIGFIKSKGNTAAETDYDFTDAAVQEGINYYRLKQTGDDGNFNYSSIIKIAYTNGNANAITIAPNPFSNSTTISFTLSQSQKVAIQIYDLDGKLIKTLTNEQMQAGAHQLKWQATGVAKGIYYLKFNAGNYAETKKISVIK
jgi:Secretion system C-terminal sorting domain